MPWTETAIAVLRTSSGETSILYEGPLLDVALSLGRSKPPDLMQVRVSLPDRHAAPRTFDGAALLALIDLSATARLGITIAPGVGPTLT